jgi:hypothetical protein
MEKSTQLSIAMENVPGQLGRLCRVMTGAKVNIRGIAIAEAADLSIIRLLVSDPEAAKRALRNAGVNFVAQQVIVLDLEDRPGGLEFVAGRLGDAGINVQYLYGTSDGTDGKAKLVLKVVDMERAWQILS